MQPAHTQPAGDTVCLQEQSTPNQETLAPFLTLFTRLQCVISGKNQNIPMGQASSNHIYVPIYIYVYTALDSQLEGSL